MATNGISGKGGDVLLGTGTPTQVAEVQRWSFNPKSNNPNYCSNRTAGYRARVAGNKDGSGSVVGKWDPANPVTAVLDVGTMVTFNLQFTGTQKYVVPGVIDNLKLDVDIDSGDVIGWSADFSTNGAWTNPIAGTLLPQGFPAGAPEGFMPYAQPQQGQGWGQRPAAPQQPGFQPSLWPAAGPQQPQQGQQPHGWPQAAPQQAQGYGQPQGWGQSQAAAQGQHNPLFAAVAQQVPGAPPELVAAITQAVVAVLHQQGMLAAGQQQRQAAQPPYASAA